MEKNNTTHEQAERLIQLGIDINTADMHFHGLPDLDGLEWHEYLHFDRKKHFTESKRPCWTLASLIGMLPTYIEIKTNESYDEGRKPHCSKLYLSKTQVAYKHYKPYENTDEPDIQCCGETFFDCVYNIVCWLLEKKLI